MSWIESAGLLISLYNSVPAESYTSATDEIFPQTAENLVAKIPQAAVDCAEPCLASLVGVMHADSTKTIESINMILSVPLADIASSSLPFIIVIVPTTSLGGRPPDLPCFLLVPLIEGPVSSGSAARFRDVDIPT